MSCLYHKYGGLSNLYSLKTPYKFAPKLWKTITKSYKRFGKYLKNQEKRFDIVMFYIGVMFVYLLIPRYRGCLLILSVIARAGDK